MNSETLVINPEEYGTDPYLSILLRAREKPQKRVMIGIPTTGEVRIEWVMARYGQIIPCNWSAADFLHMLSQYSPLSYTVADARNLVVQKAVSEGFEWLFFLDSDVLLPPDCFVRLNQYMQKGTVPVVNGLYFAKCHPPEPLIYRGRGNSYFRKFKIGDKVWVDGISMGCTLIHVSLLRAMWDEAPEYLVGNQHPARRVFDTPAFHFYDPETTAISGFSGTEDLSWCDRVIHGEFLKKSGWSKIAKKPYPFLADTSIFCKHITPTGQQFPLTLEY